MIKLKYTKETLLIATLIFTACGSGGGSSNLTDTNNTNNSNPITIENQKPIVDAGEDRKAQINVPITIWGSANDPDGTISSYEWKKGEDVLSNSAMLSYTPTILGTDKIILTVMDNDGAIASDTINIEIVDEEVEDTYNNPLPF